MSDAQLLSHDLGFGGCVSIFGSCGTQSAALFDTHIQRGWYDEVGASNILLFQPLVIVIAFQSYVAAFQIRNTFMLTFHRGVFVKEPTLGAHKEILNVFFLQEKICFRP